MAAVKADAARSLFRVDCSEIGWAVLDSGIEGDHAAFKDASGKKSRVKRSFDFSQFRKVLSLSNSNPKIREKHLEELLQRRDLLKISDRSSAESFLKALAEDAMSGRFIHWELVEKFVEIKPETPAFSNHGTHVAGIIGASKENADKAKGQSDDHADGMCPDIGLYDFRVLAPNLKDTEFAIIGALQYIRYINERNRFIAIHGANLSLSIPHDVRNFACGRTPVCEECERLGRKRRGRRRGRRKPRLSELRDQGGNLRGLRRIQHHRPGQRRRRDHRRRDPSLLAAHLRRELLLEPRADRRRPAQARSGRARRANSRADAWRRIGAISTAPAWPRRM